MQTDQFPCVLAFSSDRRYPLDPGRCTTFGGAAADVVLGHVGKDQSAFVIQREGDHWLLKPMDESIKVAVNGTFTTSPTKLDHLALIQAQSQLFVFIEHNEPKLSTTHDANRWLLSQLRSMPGTFQLSGALGRTFAQGELFAAMQGPPPELPGAFDLPAGQVLIGRDPERANLCLRDVQVSRLHAWITRKGCIATIGNLKSTNGTFVNGRRISEPTVIGEDDEIRIGPYVLVFTGTSLYPLSRNREAQLVAQDLVCHVPGREKRGKQKCILDGISLVVRPREFVCILGPSGCGKSTLLAALSARRPADEGRVLLNGEDLYAQFDALKQDLAVVPQREVLHELLPLESALRYTAKLRLPEDMSRSEIDDRITEMLDSVRLLHHGATQIRRLSGGQRRRASCVNEVICNPGLIFLDEVTSGLDEQTDSEMMQLFARMADQGKTIVCVTHRVGYVQDRCHQVAILGPGGVLAFYGPPAEALEFFGIPHLSQVYQRLLEKSPEEWKRQFRESSQYERYVTGRLPDETPKRKEPPASRKRNRSSHSTALRQWFLLAMRYFAIFLADKRALAMILGQSLLIATLLTWVFGNIAQPDAESEAKHLAEIAVPGVSWTELLEETQTEFRDEAEGDLQAKLAAKVLFLLCISCVWFGCNNAAKEIVKENSIRRQERDVGQNIVSYYGSKLVLLGLVSVLQSGLLFTAVRYFTGLGGDAMEQFVLLSAASLAGVALGLAISAMASSEDVAVTMVPVLLIPQVIMAGLIAPLEAYARVFAQLTISAYWSYQGLLGTLDKSVQGRLRRTNTLDLGSEFDLAQVCSALTVHVLLLAILAIVALYLRDIQSSGRLGRWTRFGRKRQISRG